MLKILLLLLSRMPLRTLYLMSVPLFFFLRVFYRRRTTAQNLRNSFPQFSNRKLRKVLFDYYENLSEIIPEIIKARTISKEELASRVHFINPEITFELKKKNQPILFLTAHCANWEWIALASAMHLSVPADIVYKQTKNTHLNEFLLQSRTRFGGRMIPKNEAAKYHLHTENEHRIIGLAADQTPVGKGNIWTNFLNQQTDFHRGLLTLLEKRPIATVFCRQIKTSKGHYSAELIPLNKAPYNEDGLVVLGRYIQELEKLIKEYPSQFLWSHNRWKHKRDENEILINFSKN
ncbi:MAG: lysophospholipid acyltransferase family protein [Bacteroidota bacterium]